MQCRNCSKPSFARLITASLPSRPPLQRLPSPLWHHLARQINITATRLPNYAYAQRPFHSGQVLARRVYRPKAVNLAKLEDTWARAAAEYRSEPGVQPIKAFFENIASDVHRLPTSLMVTIANELTIPLPSLARFCSRWRNMSTEMRGREVEVFCRGNKPGQRFRGLIRLYFEYLERERFVMAVSVFEDVIAYGKDLDNASRPSLRSLLDIFVRQSSKVIEKLKSQRAAARVSRCPRKVDTC